MNHGRCTSVLILVLIGSCAIAVANSKSSITIRGKSQEIYLFTNVAVQPDGTKILFLPGDAGCRGFAVTISEELAKAGYETYCLDTLHYLQSFTGSTVLATSQIASDFHQVADWIQHNDGGRLVLVGWSEGAGLGLVAAGSTTNQGIFAGLIAIGTPETNILAWRWRDAAAWITKGVPHEPTFKSADFVHSLFRLPLFFIASSSNEYITPEATRALFDRASEPKRLAIINAKDHKYSGNTGEFFTVLRQALNWVQQQSLEGTSSH